MNTNLWFGCALCAAALLLPTARPSRRLGARRAASIRVLFPLVVALLGLVLVVGPASLVASAVIVFSTVAWTVRRSRARTHATALRAHTSTYLGYIIGDLHAGNGLPHALGIAVHSLDENTPAALYDAARIAATRAASGGDGAEVLIASECADLVRVGQLWEAAGRHGIPLVELCENAQQRIDTQLNHAAATAAALQGPKVTAVVLSALPIVGIGMGGALGADPLRYLLGGGIGGLLLVLGTTLTAAGFIWSQHIMAKATP